MDTILSERSGFFKICEDHWKLQFKQLWVNQPLWIMEFFFENFMWESSIYLVYYRNQNKIELIFERLKIGLCCCIPISNNAQIIVIGLSTGWALDSWIWFELKLQFATCTLFGKFSSSFDSSLQTWSSSMRTLIGRFCETFKICQIFQDNLFDHLFVFSIFLDFDFQAL